MKVDLAGRRFMMQYLKFLKLKLTCIWGIQEQSITVKNVEDIMGIYLKMAPSQQVKDIVTMERV
jgi:hypothetical protein